MICLSLRFIYFLLILIISTDCMANANDFKFLWFEAEDAIDHSFDKGHGIPPSLFAPPEYKEKLKISASNGSYFNINAKTELWHKEDYYIKYEVIIPEEGNYSLYVKERIVAETSPVQWRFDEGEWRIVKEFKKLPDSQNSQQEISWVNYGNISLSKGKHILQLVIEKNSHSTYCKQIDAFVLAKDKFTPNEIIKPKGTIDLEQTISITLSPNEVINNRFRDFNLGVSFLMEWFTLYVEPKRPELYKEVFKIMDNIGVSLTRYTPFMNRIFTIPNFFSSPQWDKIKNWFKKRGVDVKNNKDILNYIKNRKREKFMKEFYKFVDEENIIFKEPLIDFENNKYLSKIDNYYKSLSHYKIKLIHCITGIPQWLSSNPLAKDWNVFAPRDYSAYGKLWELTVAYFTTKYPDVEQYWEVHNEPELNDFFRVKSNNQREKIESYLKMYDAAVKGARMANPNIKIGGPASIDGGGIYVEALIKHCAEKNIKLDFISWHTYHERPIIYKNKIQKVKSLLNKYGLKNVAVFIDEWAIGFPKVEGISPYHKKSILQITDSNINAAFAAACLQTMMDNGADISNFHCLRNSSGYASGLIIEDIGRSPVYTKKPLYYSFKMFNMLDNKRIRLDIDSSQNIGAIATKSDDGRQVNLLIWSYDPIERIKKRNIKIKLPEVENIKYDRYLIDSQHTLLGAEELDMVEKNVISKTPIEIILQPNSVTLLKINLIEK